MTWALAEISQLIAVSYSLRASLKTLKNISIINSIETINKNNKQNEAGEVLMFWSIFALFLMWEVHIEFLVKWIPCYYYAKSLFILAMAFTKLRLTHVVFYDFLIPFIDRLNRYFKMGSFSKLPSASDVLINVPFFIILLCFPFLDSKNSSININKTKGKEILSSNENQINNEKEDYIYGEEDCIETNKKEDNIINRYIEVEIDSNEIQYNNDSFELSHEQLLSNSLSNTPPLKLHSCNKDRILESSRRLSSMLPVIKKIKASYDEDYNDKENIFFPDSVDTDYNLDEINNKSPHKVLSPSEKQSTPTPPPKPPRRAIPNASQSSKYMSPISPLEISPSRRLSNSIFKSVRNVNLYVYIY
jgi:hypothetical protein